MTAVRSSRLQRTRRTSDLIQWAAVPSAKRLALVCLALADQGLTVREQDLLELEDDSLEALRRVYSDAKILLDRHDARSLIVQRPHYGGPSPTSPLSYRVEGALAVLPHIDVTSVNSTKVRGWVKRIGPDWPNPPPDAKGVIRSLWERAYQTAAYGLYSQLEVQKERVPTPDDHMASLIARI